MSDLTKIEWANHTGGPHLGCHAVSPGCANCYAWALAEGRLNRVFREAYQKAGFEDWETRPVWGRNATRVLTRGFWDDARRLDKAHAREGTRGRWFPSMIDWLDDMPGGMIDQDGCNLVPIAVLADFLKLIDNTPNLDWLLLTKRPENWQRRLVEALHWVIDYNEANDSPPSYGFKFEKFLQDWIQGIQIPLNVSIGVSVEDQPRADERIPQLLKIPAKVRFLSVEPLLGHIDLRLPAFTGLANERRACGGYETTANPSVVRYGAMVDWVIVGGESGPETRPCNIDWIRDVVRQCKAAGVPCFVKQLGSNPVKPTKFCDGSTVRMCLKHPKGGEPSEWPEELRVREFPE